MKLATINVLESYQLLHDRNLPRSQGLEAAAYAVALTSENCELPFKCCVVFIAEDAK